MDDRYQYNEDKKIANMTFDPRNSINMNISQISSELFTFRIVRYGDTNIQLTKIAGIPKI
jgi:hypothetical protein